MVDKALNFVLGELDGHLKAKFGSVQELVVLSNIVDQDGSVPTEAENKLILTLINTERESAAQSANAFPRSPAGTSFSHVNPPLNLNLYLLVAAQFSNYDQALLMLSSAIGFFQGKQVFTSQNTPTFPRELEKLTVEIVNVKLEELSHLWGAIGAKYVPSIIYKIRMLTIQEAWVTEEIPPITGIDTTTV